MIDIRQPSSQNLQPLSKTSGYSMRFVAGIILTILVIGAIAVAWIFLRESRTIEFAR